MNAKDNINRGSESPEARFLKGLVWVAVAGLLAACEINDPVGEISRPGFIAAGVYWDVPVTNVTAGNEVAFQAQYWSVDKRFTSLGVWYDVVRKMKYSLIFPPTGFTFLLDSTELVRESQEIRPFVHDENGYSGEKKAFVIDGTFPVSYTLAALEYKNPLTWEQTRIDQLIPEGVRKRFINGFFAQLGYQDFKTLLVTQNGVVPADTLETWFDTVTTDGTVSRPVKPEALPLLRQKVDQLPFSALVYNKNRQFYAVEFSRNYELNARFRVVNGQQVANFSDVKRITVF